MTLNQMEKALKRYKSENDGLRTQVDMLQSYNAQLQKNNKEFRYNDYYFKKVLE